MTKSARTALAWIAIAAALPVALAAANYPASSRPRPNRESQPLAAPLGLPDTSGLLVNGDFETNGGAGTTLLTGWTVVSLASDAGGGEGAGNWYAQSGTTAPESGYLVEAPPQGLFAAMTDALGAGAHVLYQDVAVPAQGARLVCDVSVLNDAGFYADNGTLDWGTTSNQTARLDVMNPSAPIDDLGTGVLANVFRLQPGDANAISYHPVPIDLTPWAGQNVRLRFAEVDNEGILNVGVDNCRTSTCTPDAETACLLSGRFEVKVQWTDFAAASGPGKVMSFGSERAESDESAFFWFFSPANFEMGVKMVDACVEPFNRYWVFVSGLTNVEYRVTVRDTATEAVQTYDNPLGLLPTTEGDTQAFLCP